MNKKIKRYYFQIEDDHGWILSKIKNFLVYLIFFFRGSYFNYSLNKTNNKLINLYRNVLFRNRGAVEIENHGYINFNNKKMYDIEYGNYTIPAYIVSGNEKIGAKIELNDNWDTR